MLKKINLQVAGMTCAVCVANIESAIGELAGAYKIVVSLAMGSEQVKCSPEVTSCRNC